MRTTLLIGAMLVLGGVLLGPTPGACDVGVNCPHGRICNYDIECSPQLCSLVCRHVPLAGVGRCM